MTKPPAMSRIEKALRLRQLALELGDYDSNVNGMVGEIIAEEHYGMHKAPRRTSKVDGWLPDGRGVQVKVLGNDLRDQVTIHTSGVDVLLVLKIEGVGWRQAYFGSAAAAIDASSYKDNKGKKSITLYHLGKCPGVDRAYIADLMQRYNQANEGRMQPYPDWQIDEIMSGRLVPRTGRDKATTRPTRLQRYPQRSVTRSAAADLSAAPGCDQASQLTGETRRAFEELRKGVLALRPDVTEAETSRYIGYKAGRIFLQVEFIDRRCAIRCSIASIDYVGVKLDIKEHTTPFTLRKYFTIHSPSEVPIAIDVISVSLDALC